MPADITHSMLYMQLLAEQKIKASASTLRARTILGEPTGLRRNTKSRDNFHLPEPGLRRSFTRLKLLIGLQSTEFDVKAELLDQYSPYFATHPVVRQFSWPQLTSSGVRNTLKIIEDIHHGYSAGLGPFNQNALASCYDVYNCAHEWQIPEVKQYICGLLSEENLLQRIFDYKPFITQLYLLLGMYGDEEHAKTAIITCLNTLEAEHKKLNPKLLPIRAQPVNVIVASVVFKENQTRQIKREGDEIIEPRLRALSLTSSEGYGTL
ncbi:hypothetical protein TWF694_005466 [Orbilia ellipsospora]|uniref:Uncharacterized protein n=1 Tax=Orbilia ellipsospora TaxID=2528407 RepID=A0AAV9WZ86_9PEZI